MLPFPHTFFWILLPFSWKTGGRNVLTCQKFLMQPTIHVQWQFNLMGKMWNHRTILSQFNPLWSQPKPAKNNVNFFFAFAKIFFGADAFYCNNEPLLNKWPLTKPFLASVSFFLASGSSSCGFLQTVTDLFFKHKKTAFSLHFKIL